MRRILALALVLAVAALPVAAVDTVKAVNVTAIANVKAVGATTTANVKTINGVSVSAGSSYITSVQNATVTIGSGSATGTATLSPSVNLSYAVVFWGGISTTGTTGSDGTAYLVLTNSTTLTATRNGTTATTLTVYCTVVEFDPAAITSIQAGTISMALATSNTATLGTSVDTAKSTVLYLGDGPTNTSSTTLNRRGSVTLTNATTVTANKGASTGTTVVSFQVVEWTSTVLQSVQQLSAAYTSASTTDTATITSVTAANSLLLPGGQLTPSLTTATDFFYRGEITNGTTVTWTRNGTSTTSRTPYGTVLEFKSGVLTANQQGSVAVNSATSNTGSITSASTTKSWAIWQGYSTDGGVNTYEAMSASVAQTSTTVVTATKGSSGATATTVGYVVPTFQ